MTLKDSLGRQIHQRKKGGRGVGTIYGDIDISGHFAAGRDINIRKLTTNLPALWRDFRTEKIRRKLLSKVLPKWIAEEEVWSERPGGDFPVTLDYGIKHVAHPRREIDSLPAASKGKTLDSRDFHSAYENSMGRLLVLGEPGSGKTFFLRKIMRYAISQAEDDEHNPVPFYLHLSTWGGPRADFESWIIDSISRTYGVHEQHLEQWLADTEIAIIIDGLDELPLRRRRECFTILNRFLRGRPTLAVVVACRQQEYAEAKSLLELRAAVIINPLTVKSLSDTLRPMSSDFRELRNAVNRSARLRSLLCNPLFLHLALETYRHAESVTLDTSKSMQNSLLGQYIDHCERRAGLNPDESGSSSWLAATAQALRARRIISFYPDRAPVEFFPAALEKQLERRVKWLSFTAVVAPTVLARGLMVAFADQTDIRAFYAALAFLFPITFGIMAMKIAKDELSVLPAARTTAAKKNAIVFFKRTAYIFIAQGALAYPLTPLARNQIISSVILIGFPISLMWPPMKMLRSSARVGRDRLPLYPGEEISSVLRAAVTVGLLVSSAFYAAITLSMSALYEGLKSALLYAPEINTLFYAIPIGILAALINGGADLIRRRACVALMVQNGLLSRDYFNVLESLRRSSILIPRLGSFEFRHLMVRDYLADKAPAEFMMRRNMSLIEG
ncbi:NACHT domain-containing protein [Kitasatospora xanthocidica]|uniref:NACHT domain-containing protein n=1 Tax=Kitasatospora xanthocidica TaxID=83382 RepID=A0A372ZTT4_9ACTN|nr:NACHT domain-containing protein [Kitasatospora xanthocidica]RGD59328.1 NACHT domain-containing protein [Kitasatospora xanthocidica]